MAETTKKAKAPAKPRKSGTKTNTVAADTPPATMAHVNGAANHRSTASHEEIARLAHQFWAERGHQHGRHEDDWFRAEQTLHKKAS